jgi:TolB-like protein/tRNA A-37 threonylcarbamoyl transferase component Bud32/Tfp pilus assembly protein PilF
METLDALRDALVGRYALGEAIGRGGMATVFLARDLRHDRRVALKVLHQNLAALVGAERFLREIRITARLQHPHILPVFDSGDDAGQLWYAMPYIEGESLRHRLSRERRLPVNEAIRLAGEVAEALDYAHAEGVVHRDIKPENVLLSRGHALLADFGIARVSSECTGNLTAAGLALGTPAYMSPEQWTAEAVVDGRSDQYALGCVLFELLSGEPPHAADTPQAILVKRILDPAPSLRRLCDVPLEVEEAVSRALAGDPAGRFASAGELAGALGAIGPLVSGAIARRTPARSVVVLPFANLSKDAENDFFGEGFSEEVITALSRVKSLRVIARSSAQRFKDSEKPAGALARELGVQFILGGGVRRSGSKLRVTVQLVDAPKEEQLWADRFDGEIADVFDIQDRIARAVVQSLEIRLSTSDEQRIVTRRISDVRAFECYLRSRHEAWRLTPDGLERAADLLAQGLAISGPNELLLGTLGMIHVMRAGIGQWGESAMRQAEQCAEDVVRLTPDSGFGSLIRGTIHMKRGEIQHCVRQLKGALAREPNNADALLMLSNAYLIAGKEEAANPVIDRLLELDPLTPTSQMVPAFREVLRGNAEAALPSFRRLIALDPGSPWHRFHFGWTLAYAGERDEARRVLASIQHPMFGPAGQCFAHALAGEREAAHRILSTERKEQFAGVEFLARMVGTALGLLGEPGEAVEWLERSARLGFTNYRFFAQLDPLLAPLRGRPEFEAFLKGMRQRWEEFET